jgi:hypothetical protein
LVSSVKHIEMRLQGLHESMQWKFQCRFRFSLRTQAFFTMRRAAHFYADSSQNAPSPSNRKRILRFSSASISDTSFTALFSFLSKRSAFLSIRTGSRGLVWNR